MVESWTSRVSCGAARPSRLRSPPPRPQVDMSMSTSATHPRLSLAIRLAPFVTSAAVAALGVFVLVGWQLDVEFLKSLLHPGKVAMNPATAVCFILLAAAVWLVAKFPTPQRRMTVARGLACVVAGVALV